jgi:hypothetical protein
MELSDARGRYLSLKVLGYEFESPSNVFDANWLLIEGEVAAPIPRWRFVDPCLQVHELAKLSHWLEAVVRDRLPKKGRLADYSRVLVFYEPNLTFELLEAGRRTCRMRVTLSLECAPAGPLRGRVSPNEPFVLEIEPSLETMATAYHELAADLARFPERLPPR